MGLLGNSKSIVYNYQICSKNIPLADFTFTITGKIISGITSLNYSLTVEKIYSENSFLFPKQWSDYEAKTLLDWLKSRKIPKNRCFVQKIIAALEENGNPLKYIEISNALSLNDTFWVNNLDFPKRWKDINLYNNDFDKILAYIAFTGYSRKIKELHSSPELTTGGMQRKSWVKRSNKNCLIKGISELYARPGRNDVYSEYYASQIADVLKISHVTYNIEFFQHENGEKEPVSLCEAFTDENIGYIAIAYMLKNTDGDLSDFEKELEIGEIFGKEAFEDMMLLDSIIINTDRHLGNFGLLYDNDTGKIIGPAPLFDHGMSMLIGAAKKDFEEIDEYLNGLYNPFEITFDEMMRRFVRPRHIEPLKKLSNYKLIPVPGKNNNPEYINYMTDFIQKRAIKAIAFCQENAKNNMYESEIYNIPDLEDEDDNEKIR